MHTTSSQRSRLWAMGAGMVAWVVLTLTAGSQAHPGKDAQGDTSRSCSKLSTIYSSKYCAKSNPIDVCTGNAHRELRDLEIWGGVGDHPLVFIRYHNSRLPENGQVVNSQFGTAGQWRHAYQWDLISEAATDLISMAPDLTIVYPDRTQNTFTPTKTSPSF